jgi:sensor histidine kinase YesM
MKDKLQASNLGFWQLQCMGWTVLCVLGMLDELPFHEGKWIYIYWVVFSALGFTASLALRLICRRLMAKQFTWLSFFGATAVASYLLAFICSVIDVSIERRLRGNITDSYHWSGSRLLGPVLATSVFNSIILVAWNGIYFGIKQAQSSFRKEEQLLRLEALARDAELRALRSQITPHFLFNTLNGISTLVGESNIEAAREMIALLGDFLRTTLETSESGDVTLAHEIRHMNQYLSIEQVRLEDRLRLAISIDPGAGDALVPNLLLQPLIENAILHGISQGLGNGLLDIKANLAGEEVVVVVSNTTEAQTNSSPSRRLRDPMGITNTRSRLSARYGAAAGLEIHNENSAVWQVVLKFPYEANSNVEDSHR